ncbi:MAG: glycosyltransferase [Bacteroidales bacterium]|nr:glycosyltransferase [Bacteroidales bacterium]
MSALWTDTRGSLFVAAISVIVPVYNVEKYLPRCIDSILTQTFVDFECILVDDGSSDGCPRICDAYAGQDKRIRVIHQVNSGTAAARHAGVNSAQGALLFFVDSDDWIEKDALRLLYIKQKETDADIVLGGIRDVYEKYDSVYLYPKVTTRDNPLSFLFINRGRVVWGRLYKKELFRNLILPNTNNGEDAIINVQIFSKLKPGKLQKIDFVIYNYDHNSGGITTRTVYAYKSHVDSPHFISRFWIENYLDRINADRDTKSAFYLHLIRELINAYLRHNKKISREEINIFYDKYYIPCAHKNMIKLRERIIVPLFHAFIPLGKLYAQVLNLLAVTNKFFAKIIRVVL